MKCKDCKRKVNENSRFCPFCGALLSEKTTVVLCVNLGMNLLGGRSCEKLVKDIEAAMKDADGNKLIGLLPPKIIEYESNITGDSTAQIKEEMRYSMKYTLSHLCGQLGKDYDFSLSLEKKDMFDEKELSDIRRYLERRFSIDPESVKDAASLDITFEVKNGNIETSNTAQLEAVKIDRDWYLTDIADY